MIVIHKLMVSRQAFNSNTLMKCINSALGKTVFYSNSSSSDDENTKSKTSRTKDDIKQTKTEAINKLNLLLNQMVEDDVHNAKSAISLAKPKDKRTKNLEQPIKEEPIEQKIVFAAKDVAKSMGGDVKQTESELLTKLLNPIEESTSLSDIVKGMKIDRDQKPPEIRSRAEQVRQLLQRAEIARNQPEQTTRARRFVKKVTEFTGPIKSIDLFGEKPLNILTADGVNAVNEGVVNKTWKTLYERELRLAVTHPPANYFQQQILWTEQGKLWKFPIDNEQGMEEEQNIYFTEHIFLEKHLEPWCPPKGPIRHFMELVCIGLSKNHYLSVQHKKDHIEWFKNYFEDKKQLLQDVGAIPPESGTSSSKPIEH